VPPSATSSTAKRERLDRLLVARGLAESRERATRLILAGSVRVNAVPASKAGQLVREDAAVELLARSPYVSRGGEKLVHALRVFGVTVEGRVCLDVGASTGGFTHCLLLEGADHVYAVDVGRGQLDPKLRNDPRVIVREGVNARFLTPHDFAPRPSLATVDVSFISLEKVLEAVVSCLTDDGEVIALVKPQFEVGRREVGKGVVRDRAKHRRVLAGIADWAMSKGLAVRGVTASPLRGPKGNREFFLRLGRQGDSIPDLPALIARVVEAEEIGG
jgi:23S rRNA (cytidine1920-2'-O)/16S rRNA (cytidine1409-2'-O)-methyltransferase